MAEINIRTDAWVNEAKPSLNYDKTNKLRVRGTGTSAQQYAFLFVAPPFPPSATVISATLTLHTAAAWSGTSILTAKRVTETWKEHHVTWTNKPDVSATNSAAATVTDASAGDSITLDIADMLNDVSSGSDWFGIRLELDDDAERQLVSSDNPTASERPTLDIEWRELPEAPVNLVPNDQHVSVTSPVLSWQFSERGSSDAQTQASSQVQIHSTSDFTTPDYDSTKQANTESQWDLTGEDTLADAETVFWRVRVWDDNDAVSDWSDTSTFTRTVKGTLTLTNPPAAPSNTVDDLTPPITWSLSSATQEAYALSLYRVDGGTRTLVHSVPMTVSTDTSYTLPVLSSEYQYGVVSGGTYEVVVTVADDVDRVYTPGDSPVYQVSREFTYVRNGTPDPVTTVTATASDAKVTVAWTRSATPDYFSLRVDDVEVMPRIDPADVLVSGTSYEIDYWGAKPRVSTTYEVEAVVDSAGDLQHSDGNDTDTAETSPVGLWLADPDDGKAVQVLGAEGLELEIRVVGETFDVIGSRKPVRITDVVGGYVGSVAGFLGTKTDRDDFLELAGRLKELRAVLGDLNLPVTLTEIATQPMPLPNDRLWEVSFGLLQAGEFADAFELAGG